jgi:protein TonB
MQALLHSMNISTLATWLSVGGFGTVAVIVPPWEPGPQVALVEETSIIDDDFTLGDGGDAETTEEAGGPALSEQPETLPQSLPETLPTPPELPAMEEFSPLPEIPELPAAPAPEEEMAPKPAIKPSPAASSRKVESTPRASTSSSRSSSSTRSGGSTKNNGSVNGKSGNTGSAGNGSGSGMSDATRLSKGRMPSPSYPSESRRKGQTGTVMVEFTVDSSGKVISAYAKSPSPWPLLNNEAVRTVRRWKFPPGGIMKLQRPIVFQLR